MTGRNVRTSLSTFALAAVLGLGMLTACSSSDVPTSEATTAGEIAKAIDADPPSAASILKEHGFTEADFEALLFRIAADEAASRAYLAARN